MGMLRLKPGREKSLLRRHPWVFSGAVARLDGDPGQGGTVRLENAHGQFLAWGAYSPHSQIRARIWSWEANEGIDESFFRSRLAAALAARRELIPSGESDALRLVHAESDGLPGLIVDRYTDTLVVQFLSSGAERWRDLLVNLLLELSGAANIYERSDVEVRRLEGLPERNGPLHGAPPERVQIQEAGLKF
jgi:23S rRNA (cytosine1962-C5)-methyltransferase